MKTRILFLLICSLLSLSAVGQGIISRQKCTTCGKVMAQCPYKGKHPKPKPAPKTSKPTTPAVKYCDICGKPLNLCDYGGKHPYCQTCGKLKERCEYNGEHPVCEICGKLKEKCEYNGEHPVCKICGKLEEECVYKGVHPVCETCGKVKEQCAYNGKHPVCKICGKLKENCEYKGDHQTEQTFSVGNVSFTVMLVEGGTFTMGTTSEQQNPTSDENLAHSVTLSSYYIGKFEVTQALWEAVMGRNTSNRTSDDLPVKNVSWVDCQAFLRKLNAMTGHNFRLPTEAEWEYAARGGNRSQGYQYSGSNNLNDVAWYNDNGGRQTHIVGTKSPNELGIYDMSGNVWEWCQDWLRDYNSSAQTNPTGPGSGSCHVIRGGCWISNDRSCRVSDRNGRTPDTKISIIGFRLALSL